MTDVILCNGHIMVKEIKRKKDEETTESGLFIPEEVLDDEQVSQGFVVRSSVSGYEQGDVVLFHKMMPVDVNMKLDNDKGLETYFFIKESDVICRIVNK